MGPVFAQNGNLKSKKSLLEIGLVYATPVISLPKILRQKQPAPILLAAPNSTSVFQPRPTSERGSVISSSGSQPVVLEPIHFLCMMAIFPLKSECFPSTVYPPKLQHRRAFCPLFPAYCLLITDHWFLRKLL